METIQSSGETGQDCDQDAFAALLRQYTRAAGFTYEELAEGAGLPVDTVMNWLKGRVRRPRNWRDLAQVARVLRLDAADADALLHAAGHLPLATLIRSHADAEVLRPWVAHLSKLAPDPDHNALAYAAAPPQLARVEIHNAPKAEIMPLPASRTLVAWRTGAAALLSGLLLIVGLVVALTGNVSSANTQGWGVIGPLELAPLSVAPDGRLYVVVGQIITATLHLRNNTSQTITLPQLGGGVRGPDGCEKNWNGQHYDFPGVTQMTEPPNGVYLYQRSVSFTAPGVYFAEPAQSDGAGHYRGIVPYPRVWFTVTADPNYLSDRDCLTPVPTRTPTFGLK
jgi:transcriptional regulator with XRE-family HTH domain